MQKVILKPALAGYLPTLGTYRAESLGAYPPHSTCAALLLKLKKISDVLPSSQGDYATQSNLSEHRAGPQMQDTAVPSRRWPPSWGAGVKMFCNCKFTCGNGPVGYSR